MTRHTHRTVALVVGEQLRDSRRLGTDFGNRSGLPQLTLADRAETHDVRDRAPSPVDEVAVRIDSHTYAARVQRRDICGQQARPERAALQRAPIPQRASGDDHRVTTPTHGAVARCDNQFNATAVQRHIGDLARFDAQLAIVDRRMKRIGSRGRHAVAKDLPLPQVLTQEPALVLPPQRAPQPGGTRPHCVDHLSPVRTGIARVREISGERGAQLLKRDLGRERIDVRQRCRRAGSAESARKRALTRQQRYRGAPRNEMQRDIYSRESRTNHQNARGPTRTKGRERAWRPWIHHNLAVGACRQHRSEGTFQRFGHAPLGAPRREHNGVGQYRTPIVQRYAHGHARHQPDSLGSLDPDVGNRELFSQVAAVRKTRREAVHRSDSSFIKPTAEVIGIVWPCGHALRRNV